MANWTALKTAIDDNIFANGAELITADVLNPLLKSMTDNLGMNYPFVDIATPGTDPGTPDGKCFYMAIAKGLYPNFSNITITGDFAFLAWNTTEWIAKEVFINQSDLTNGGGNGVSQSILQLSNISADTTFSLPANTWFEDIFAIDLSGAPLLAIGTSPGANDVVDFTPISGVFTQMIQSLYVPITLFYVTLSGGSVNLRIDIKSSLFTNTIDPFSPVTTYAKYEIDNLLNAKADESDVLLLSGASPAEIPASEADLANGLSLKADKTDVLRLSGSTDNLKPASLQDVADVTTDVTDKADKADVYLLSAPLAINRPASLGDIGLQLLWLGGVAANGTLTKYAGMTGFTISCVNGSDGVYAFTHNYNPLIANDTKYVIQPLMGTGTGLISPRTIINKLATSFTIWTSSDNTKHNTPYEIAIYKYF